MGLFDTVKEPVFLKETGSAEKQLETLKALQQQLPPDRRKELEREIKIVEAGLYGEKQILFELKNSHMPMAVLHDLYFEKDGCSAQIDFMIFTRGRIFIIECKNLIGNITIDSEGNFTRTLSFGRTFHKEGIYSPITQNRRHMELIKNIRMEVRGNLFTRAAFEKNFPVNYRSVVVLANPQTILNAKYAKKEVKNQVIRADQLIEYIRRINSGAEMMSEKEMMNLARFYLERSTENPVDYTARYKNVPEAQTPADSGQNKQSPETPDIPEKPVKAPAVTEPEEEAMTVKQNTDRIICPKCGSPMVKRVAAKGQNAGKEFYGCTGFPKCRGIVNIQ